MFVFNGQRYFVWSGWAGTTNVERNLYLARMSSPTTTTGARFVISQPRESGQRSKAVQPRSSGPAYLSAPEGSPTISRRVTRWWRFPARPERRPN